MQERPTADDAIPKRMTHLSESGRQWTGGVLYEDPVRRQVHIALGQDFGPDEVPLLDGITSDQGVTAVRHDRNQTSDTRLTIPVGLARALNDALTRHFGGSADSRTLRKDYEAERARVDRLIGSLMDRPVVIAADSTRPLG